jgi:hypothetical protein
MSDTPRTKAATRMAFTSEHMVEIEEAQKIERELAEAKETIEMLEIRHGATMLCHQAQMDEITKQRNTLAEALKTLCRAIISEEPHGITGLLKRSEAFLSATKGDSHEKYTNNG